MILCPLCKPGQHLANPVAESQVVETRRVGVERVVEGTRHKTQTVRRVRRCKRCGYRWPTVEVFDWTGMRKKR